MVMDCDSEEAAELIKALGLPKNCTRVEIVMEVGEVVKVKCEYLPEPFQIEDKVLDVSAIYPDSFERHVLGRGVKSILKEYELVERKP